MVVTHLKATGWNQCHACPIHRMDKACCRPSIIISHHFKDEVSAVQVKGRLLAR